MSYRSLIESAGETVVSADSAGRIVCDLSERRRGDERLRRSQELQSRLLKSLPDTFLALIDERYRLQLPEGAPEWLGWRPEELEGRTVRDVFPAERADALEAATRAALAGESRRLEWSALRVPGEVTLDLMPLGATEESQSTVLLVGRDVTETRARERELAAARDEALNASHASPPFSRTRATRSAPR